MIRSEDGRKCSVVYDKSFETFCSSEKEESPEWLEACAIVHATEELNTLEKTEDDAEKLEAPAEEPRVEPIKIPLAKIEDDAKKPEGQAEEP